MLRIISKNEETLRPIATLIIGLTVRPLSHCTSTTCLYWCMAVRCSDKGSQVNSTTDTPSDQMSVRTFNASNRKEMAHAVRRSVGIYFR